jgi:hypothetical protein
MRVGEVIAKLAEDAYFMRVDNRVGQVPPVRNRQHDNEATAAVQLTTDATVLEQSYRLTPTVLGQRPVDPLRVAIALEPQAVIARSSLIATLAAEAVAAGAPTTELEGGPVAEAIAAAEATRTATSPEPHMAASMPARKLKNYDRRSPPRQATTTASPPFLLGFATYSSQRNSNLWGSPSTTRSKTPYNGSDAMPSLSRTLVAIRTRSASTSPSAWIKLRLNGSSHSRSTRSTSGTSSRNSSPATSRAPWAARVLAPSKTSVVAAQLHHPPQGHDHLLG